MKRVILLISNIILFFILMACANNTEEQTEPAFATTAQKNRPALSFHIASTQPVYITGAPITLAVNLSNHTSESIAILPWGTPLESGFNSDMFTISKDGIAVSYNGRMLKRSQPTERDYIKIMPEEDLSTAIDLSQAYTIQAPGQYTIKMKPRYLGIQNNDDKNKLQKVESNSIVIEVTEY